VIAAQELATWLKAQGVDAGYSTDGRIPSQPDRLAIIQATGGPGEKRERTFDVVSFQVRARGKQRSSTDDGARLAWQVDDVLMGAVPPLTIGDTRVTVIQRQGGPPGFLERDSAGRSHFACSYLLECARTTF
jgi:hypothetical protein